MFDSPDMLIEWLQRITGALFGLGLLTLLLMLYYFRRSRNKAYWRQRRQASNRGARYGLLALIFLGFSGALCAVTLAVMFVEDGSAPSPVAEVEPTPEASLSMTHSLTPEPRRATDSPTQPAEETLNEVATDEATNDATEQVNSPTPTTLTPPEGVRLDIIALDDAIDTSQAPIQPTAAFGADSTRIYVFFNAQGLTPDVLWQQTLLREDGEVVQQYQSRWGRSNEAASGYFFFGLPESLAPGAYRIQFSYSAQAIPLAETAFTVTP